VDDVLKNSNVIGDESFLDDFLLSFGPLLVLLWKQRVALLSFIPTFKGYDQLTMMFLNIFSSGTFLRRSQIHAEIHWIRFLRRIGQIDRPRQHSLEKRLEFGTSHDRIRGIEQDALVHEQKQSNEIVHWHWLL